MAIDERSRHDLFVRLEQVLGHEQATVLMEHLPPVGWADVATKRDLDHLAVATKRDLDQLAVATKRDLDHLADRFETKLEVTEQRLLATFRAEMIAQTRIMIFSMATAFVGVTGVILAGGRLT